MAGGSQHHSCAKLTLSTSLTEKSGGSGTLSATCMCPAAVWRCYVTSLRIDTILSRNPAPPTSWRLQHIRSWNSWALSLGSKVTHSTWTWLPGPTMRCSIAWVHGETPHAPGGVAGLQLRLAWKGGRREGGLKPGVIELGKYSTLIDESRSRKLTRV